MLVLYAGHYDRCTLDGIITDNGGYALFAGYSWYDGEPYWSALSEESPARPSQNAARGSAAGCK